MCLPFFPLTDLDPLALAVRFVPHALALRGGRRDDPADLDLGHAQVQEQGGDLGVEVQAAGVAQQRREVKLQAFTDAAHLRLGQSRRQVG